jgi:hypothetical protein
MRILAAVPRPTLVTTVVFVLFLLGWQIWAAVAAAGKIAPEVQQALAQHGRAYVAVRLGFEPEKFHMTYFQDRGRVVGVQADWIYIDNADPSALQDIARQYWVQDIQLVGSP